MNPITMKVLFFKVIGVIIAIVGLILPGAMVNRSERYKTLGNFVKWSLWFIVGIAIAGFSDLADEPQTC